MKPATAATILTAALTLTGCANHTTAPAPAKPFTLTGVVTLNRGQFSWNDDMTRSCTGLSGYADLKPGAQVVVTDPAGTTVAVGSVTSGIAAVEFTPEDDLRGVSCDLLFSVADVPAGKGFYGVEVTHRGRTQHSEVAARSPLKLTLN